METATNQSVQLWVRKDSDLTYTRIDLFPEEPIKLNLSVTNIMDPLATNSVFSRTFRVPNTQSNNKFFKAVFNVNSVSFDASKKVAAYLNDSGAFYINGNIRLISTYSNDLEGDVQYEIVFMGETSDFASQIGGGFLSDINLSEYNHDQSYLNITSSWNTNQASGLANGLFNGDIVYPLINWGYTYTNGVPVQSTTSLYTGTTGGLNGFTSASHPLSQGQMKPSIRAKALWDSIFAETEYTYESDFLNSDFFKKLYIISEKQARPELNVSLVFSANNPDTQAWFYNSTPSDIYAPNETYDPNGVWEPSNSIYTAQVTSGPTYYFSVSFYAKVSPPAIPTIPTVAMTYTVSLRDADTGIAIANQIKVATNIGNIGIFTVATFNVPLTAGQRVKFTIDPSPTNPFLGVASLVINQLQISCTGAPEVVTMNSVMPDNIRKIDFMKSIINRFKLVFVPSRDNEKHFTITPWKDWILQGESKDWNNKLDTGKDIKATPLFYGQNRFQVYADQEDADFPNYTYQLAYKQTYGQLNLDSDNELLTGTITVKDQFAPTPLYPIGGAVPAAGSSPTALAAKFLIPWISKADFTAVQNNPIQPKLRLVFYNGKQPAPLNWYLYDDSLAPQQQTVYPLMSEYSYWPAGISTYDLSWQNKDPLWNTDYGNPLARTGYDTFNTYWKTWYNTNFDPYSRKVELTLVLDYRSMIELKFNNYYWIKDAWYLVNKVTDYVAGQKTPCRVELIKVGNDIGLTIPPTQGVGYPNALCFSALSYCDAYCCAQSNNTATYWTNHATLDTSSIIWQNSDQTVPANPGFYADSSGTICEVDQGGNIIAFYIGTACEPCTVPGPTEFTSIEYSSVMCTACISETVGVTVWGDGPTLDTSYYVWSNSGGTIPAANGWYVDPTNPTYAVQVQSGVVWAIGLCSTCNPTPPTPVYEARAYFTEPGAPTCDACVNTSTRVTVWLNSPTWAGATQVYLSNSTDQPAADGYWNAYEEGGTIYTTDPIGAISGTADCSACVTYYYYNTVNCNAPEVNQKFYSTVPIDPGLVISSTLFPDQCWTVIGGETSANYAVDTIHDNCKSCSETWICNCVEYLVTTDTKGSSYLSYTDCADGSIQYQEIQPGNNYNICMCENSGGTAEGRVYITPIGVCTTPPCYVWSLVVNSGTGGQVEYEECTTGLVKTIDVTFGGDYQVCAVDGTLTVLSGDITITQGVLCG